MLSSAHCQGLQEQTTVKPCCCLPIEVDKFEITVLILGLGKQGSVRNSGGFEITEFEIADNK